MALVLPALPTPQNIGFGPRAVATGRGSVTQGPALEELRLPALPALTPRRPVAPPEASLRRPPPSRLRALGPEDEGVAHCTPANPRPPDPWQALELEDGGEGSLRLSQLFDSIGSPLFRRLGLAMVVKRRLNAEEEVRSSTQSSASLCLENRPLPRTKALLLAEEALQKDLRNFKERARRLMRSVDPTQRLRVEDVQRRQVEVLFSEVPNFEEYLPPGVGYADLVPADIEREDELRDRRAAAYSSRFFADTHWIEGMEMNWMLSRPEVLVVSEIASLWTRSTHGMDCPMGMDRPTFCRFILDLGLSDQEKVPFFWAVSLFDDVSRPMRCCPPEVVVSNGAPIVRLVSRWTLITVLDTILRQYFTRASRFVSTLLSIARLRLPAWVIEESGLREETMQALASGDWPPGPSDLPRASKEPSGLASLSVPSQAAGNELPAFLRFQDQPASHLDIRREENIRDQLVRAMLVEPEVLHMAMQHLELFKKLHKCYADDTGDMSFAALLQFCTDFHLCPAVGSSYFLRTVYESVECLDLAPSLPSRSLAARRTVANVKPGINKKRTSTLFTSQSFGASMRSEASFGSSSRAAGRRRTVAVQDRPSAGGSRAASAASVSSNGGSSARPPSSTAQSLVEAEAAKPITWPLSPPWEGVIHLAEKAAAPTEELPPGCSPSTFGVGAFIEALFRVAFTYLRSYGNLQQRSMSGYMGVVWLVDYLRFVFVHLQKSAARHAALPEGQGGRLHDQLREALQGTPEEVWKQSLCAPPELPPATWRAGLPKVEERSVRMRPKPGGAANHGSAAAPPTSAVPEDKEQPARRERWVLTTSAAPRLGGPAGTPIVVDGRCGVCGKCQTAGAWGNARCRGCSVIDVTSFQHHPFKPLLVDWAPGTKPEAPVARVPTRLQRADLTPPPRCSSNALRR